MERGKKPVVCSFFSSYPFLLVLIWIWIGEDGSAELKEYQIKSIEHLIISLSTAWTGLRNWLARDYGQPYKSICLSIQPSGLDDQQNPRFNTYKRNSTHRKTDMDSMAELSQRTTSTSWIRCGSGTEYKWNIGSLITKGNCRAAIRKEVGGNADKEEDCEELYI